MNDNKYINILKNTLKLYIDTGMGVYAGNATLFIITAMFPLLMLIIAVFNMLPGYDPDGLSSFISQLLPDLSTFHSFVRSTVSSLKNQSSSAMAGISALTALWTASNGVTALQNGLKKLNNTKGNTVRDKLCAILYTFLIIILIPAVLVLQVFGSSIIELVKTVTQYLHIDGPVYTVHHFIQRSGIILAAVSFLLILLVYTYLPGCKRRLRDQFYGALAATVLLGIFTSAFSWFIPRFYHSSALYGSLAALFLVLLWLRFCMMIFFAGDALNIAVLEYKQSDHQKKA